MMDGWQHSSACFAVRNVKLTFGLHQWCQAKISCQGHYPEWGSDSEVHLEWGHGLMYCGDL